jgi:Zn-dependent protease with chaperone function
MARAVWLVGLVLTVLSLAGTAHAQRKREHEAEAMRGLDPALAKVFADATTAMDAGRTDEAAAGFDQILARAPEHAATLRRASYVRTAQKKFDEAIALARRALAAAPGSVGEAALAAALIQKPDDIAARNEAQTHAVRAVDGVPDDFAAMVAANVALKMDDLPLLGHAVQILESQAADKYETHYLAAIYHLSRDEYVEADQALTRAVARGLDPKVAAEMREKANLSQHLLLHRLLYGGLALVGIWAAGLALIFVLGLFMSHATLRAVERYATERSDALVVSTRLLRKAYKAAIGFAALYYYVSIPIIAGIVLCGGGLAIYGILQTGWIPFKILILILVVSVVSAWSLLKSLFARRAPDEDPGPRLSEAEAPGLWGLAREVAAKVGTRPVDSIFLTPGTEVAVSERGPVAARLRDQGHRFLILGVGVLDGMTRRQLSAVLAHEYGHFSNRDTAGGDVAGAVRASLFSAVVGIARGGGATVFNPAWHFLRLFLALFGRITLGASRLQETLADRFAAVAYGGAAFAEGLRHTVERTVRFNGAVKTIVTQAERERAAIVNLYAPPEGEGAPVEADLDKAVAEALADPGSAYDSHPPIAKRIAWVSAFTDVGDEARAADGPAWELFPDPRLVQGQMTAVVNRRMSEAGAIDS